MTKTARETALFGPMAELLIVVVIIGILAIITIPAFISLTDRAKESKVHGAAGIVQRAADVFAANNDGIYPDRPEDFVPLFPGGQMLENAYTGEATEPKFGEVADEPGEVGILFKYNSLGQCVGYEINGWGENSETVRIMTGD